MASIHDVESLLTAMEQRVSQDFTKNQATIRQFQKIVTDRINLVENKVTFPEASIEALNVSVKALEEENDEIKPRLGNAKPAKDCL